MVIIYNSVYNPVRSWSHHRNSQYVQQAMYANRATTGNTVLKTQNPPAKEKIPENSRSVYCLFLQALTQYALKLATFISDGH